MSVRQIELADRWLAQWARKVFPYAQQQRERAAQAERKREAEKQAKKLKEKVRERSIYRSGPSR